MVSVKKALVVSGLSALVVGVIHFIAHYFAPKVFANNQVAFVGSIVVLSVFAIAFFGMRWN